MEPEEFFENPSENEEDKEEFQSKSDSDISLDSFVDLEIEKYLGQETLMRIDCTGPAENSYPFFLFIILFLVSVVLGFFGSSSEIITSSKQKNFKESNLSSIYAKNLRRSNRFIQLNVIFLSGKETPKIPDQVTLPILIVKFKGSEAQEKEYLDYTIEHGHFFSFSHDIYTDRLIVYDSIGVKIDISKIKNIISIRSIWKMGNPSQQNLQVGFRLFYGFICLIYSIIFYKRIGQKFKLWHLEQKLIFSYLSFCFAADDPFYFIQILETTTFGVIFDILSRSFFTIFLQLFVLILFDLLCFKNRQIDKLFYIIKIIFFLPFLFVEIFHEFISDSQVTYIENMFSDTFKYSVNLIHLLFEVIYIFWLIKVIIISGAKTDATERYKFSVYTTVSIISIFVLLLTKLILTPFKFLSHTSLSFVLTYSIQNIYVFIMTYLHWPYELLTMNQEQQQQQQIPTH